MNNDFWFPWYPVIFRADTMHLTCEEDGMYRRLIDAYMETRRPLPDNDVALARLCGCSMESFKDASSILRAFFKQSNGVLHHDFCDKILDEQDKRSTRRSEIAKNASDKRWKTRPENKQENASSILEGMHGDATGQDKTEQDKKETENTLGPENVAPAAPPAKPDPRGTRLPDDWQLPDEWLEWGLKNTRLTRVLILKQEVKFKNYWIAKAGANARKTNWRATWINWLNKTEEDNAKSGGYNRDTGELRGIHALDAVQSAARRAMAAEGSQGPSAPHADDRDPGAE